jgi:hypothetical protein
MLPEAAQSAIDRVLANPRSPAVQKLLDEALAAVDYPHPANYFVTVYPIPETCTPAQHALLAMLCDERVDEIHATWALPFLRAGRRRWLGLDPGGALESASVDVVVDGKKSAQPLWRALQISRTLKGMGAVLNQLPFDVALRAIGELLLGSAGTYKLTSIEYLFTEGDLRLVRELRAQGRAWAIKTASMLVKARVPPHHALLPYVFLALVRARVPITRAMEKLLPRRGVDDATYLELVRALPKDRRDAVLAPHLFWMDHAQALRLMEALGTPVLVKAFLKAAQKADPRRWETYVAKVETLSAKNATMRMAIEEAKAERIVPVKLVVVKRLVTEDAAKLGALRRKQVRRAGFLFDGRDLPASARLGLGKDWDGDPEMDPRLGKLEIQDIADSTGKVKYTAVLFLASDGLGWIFEAGTTNEIGHMTYGAVTLKREDTALMLGLDRPGSPPVQAKKKSAKRSSRAK